MATRKIETELKLTGEKQFNDQMKAINNGLKTTRSDMSALSSEFDDNANSVKALTSKQKLLQSSVEQHKAKVAALQAQYEAAAATLGENEATTQRYKQQLNAATVALNKESAALDKNADALKGKYLAGLKAVSAGAKNILGGIGTAAGNVAKGVGVVSAAAAAGVAAIGAGGVVALTTMINMAREAADAAKAAQEAGENLTESQQQWLAYSQQLDALDASVANAKGALAGVLLPMLGDLSTEGAAFLNDFTRDMTAAAGNTEQQTQVLCDYIIKGANLIKENLPEYIAAGKELLAGLGDGLSESAPELLDMGIDLVTDLLNAIIEYAPNLAQAGISLIQRLCESLIERGPDLVTAAAGMVSEITSGLAQAAPSLIPAAVQLIVQLIAALVSNAPMLLEAGLELIYGLIQGLFNGLGDIANSAGQIVEVFETAFGDCADVFLNIGSKIINLIRDGISNAWDGLVSWFNGLWDKLFSKRSVDVNVNGSSGVDGSHAGGLDYVPFDGYLAELHRGERVLTAREASEYRRNQSQSGAKIFNLTIKTQSLSKEDLDMIVDYMNRKLGDDL